MSRNLGISGSRIRASYVYRTPELSEYRRICASKPRNAETSKSRKLGIRRISKHITSKSRNVEIQKSKNSNIKIQKRIEIRKRRNMNAEISKPGIQKYETVNLEMLKSGNAKIRKSRNYAPSGHRNLGSSKYSMSELSKSRHLDISEIPNVKIQIYRSIRMPSMRITGSSKSQKSQNPDAAQHPTIAISKSGTPEIPKSRNLTLRYIHRAPRYKFIMAYRPGRARFATIPGSP